jgi:DNA-binding transcriptional LysR family regulator
MHSPLDWNDLRMVLAVYREGTLSGAARRLDVTHSTVFRRLGAIEERMSASATAMRRRRLARQRPRPQPAWKTRC